MSKGKDGGHELLRDAEDYVQSVLSSQVSAILRTPLPNRSGRKRQLSMPDESVIKKVKASDTEERMVRRAKRTLYNENETEKSATVSGRESGADAGIIKVDEQKEEQEKSDTVSSISGSQKKGKKKGKKSKKDESEVIVTTAEVHVDGDLSDMDTRDLLMAVLSQMQNNFSVLGKKLESLETNLEKKLTDKISKTLDKRVNAESTKLRKVIDDQVGDLRKEFESDLDDISEKIAHLTSVVNKKDAVQANDDDTRKMNIVLRKLPESTNEDLNNKVNSLIKDGLKIKDIHVRSTERKQSFNESIPGVVVATLGSLDDKKGS